MPGAIIGGAVAGATVAGVLVGLGEAVVVTLQRQLGLDPGLLFFALLFYGLTGVALGFAIGVGLVFLSAATGRAITRPLAYAASGAATLAVLVTTIGRFRVFRDLLNESFDGRGISPLVFRLASVAVLLALFAVTFVALRAIARRQARSASAAVVLGGLIVALALSAGGMQLKGEEVSPPVRDASGPAPAGPSVVLIIVDTLRPDHLSCYGAANPTPAIDALASAGTRFTQAYAQASWTRPSVATILTSLYPSSHRAVHKNDVLPDEVVTLPEVMQAAGYRTVGFADNINIAPLFNFHQGFDEYVFLEPEFFFGATESAAQLAIYNQLRLVRERYLSDVKHVENYYQPAEVVTARGLDWIAHHGTRPFFMLLHYMDPHDPYFTHPYNGEALARVTNPNPDPALADRYRAAYDGEISYLDTQLARFFGELRARGLYDRSLIVLTSDHGEEFCEHGGWWHGLTLYEEQIAVPLIVKPPRGSPDRVVSDALVSTLDIAPTILATAGIAVPDAMQGKALGLDAGEPAPRDHTFAEQDLEGNILQAYRSDGLKLILANLGNPRGLPARQLFEVTTDRREQHDLAASREDQVATLRANLAALQSHAEAIAAHGGETAIDSATEERLRALGYVH